MGSGLIRKQKIPPALLDMSKSLRKAMTPAERRFCNAVRGNRLGGLHFRRQQWVEGFLADFYCETLKLVIELDGGVHEHQKGYDRLRDAAIRKLGLRVMRFGNDEVMDQLDRVIEKVKASTLPPRSPSPAERGVRGKVG